MQRVVYRELTVEGGKEIDQVIPQPPTQHGYYQDLAVFAYPSLPGEGANFMALQPEISVQGGPQDPEELQRLFDGEYLFKYRKNSDEASEPYSVVHDYYVTFDEPTPEEPVLITLKFEEPFTARSFSLGYVGGRLEGVLEYSDEGDEFTPLVAFTFGHPQFRQTHNFQAVSGTSFRLRFTSAHGLNLSEFELCSRFSVDGYFGEILEAAIQTPPSFQKDPALTSEDCINPDDLRDLTDSLSPDGRLRWRAPAGKWTILRIGYTPVGIRNRYGRRGGEGLETDKLSAVATEIQWRGFMARLIEDLGPLTGQVLKGVFIDSHETGFQNWTPGFREEFIARRGYDPLPLLPVFCNRNVDNPDVTARFAWDVRRTHNELMTENYTGRFAELCEENGLQFSIQPHGEGIVDHVTMGSKAHVPAANFWIGSGLGDREVGIAHAYGREVISAEAFTYRARWDVDPYVLKKTGDNAFATGINHFKIHSYVHQPWLNRAPGMVFSVWGMCFNRHLTWWEQAKPWLEYVARCQYLLRQGLPVADLVGYREHQTVYIPPQFKHHPCNYDAIEKRMTVANGKIVLPNGMRYRILTLEDSESMTVSLARAVRRLVADGAIVVGPKPLRSPSLQNQPQTDVEIAQIADEVWGEVDANGVIDNAHGKGRVVWGRPIPELLNELGIRGDFEFQPHDPEKKLSLRFNHRRSEDADIYFIHNGSEARGFASCTFRVNGKTPELWCPDTGRIVPYRIVRESADGRTVLPIWFEPYDTVFVLFRAASSAVAPHVVSVDRDGLDVLTSTPNGQAPAVLLQQDAKGIISAVVSQTGTYAIGMSDGAQKTFEVAVLPDVLEVEGPWELQFPTNWGAPPAVHMPTLISWTDHEDPGVRYFSGTATYRTLVVLDEDVLGPRYRTILDLGQVKNIAQVYVNGKDCGIVWKEPFVADITEAVKAGNNKVDVQVTNLWPNRLIGDERQFPDNPSRWPERENEENPDSRGRLTFTSFSPYTKDSPLLESGLLGPVRILTEATVRIE